MRGKLRCLSLFLGFLFLVTGYGVPDEQFRYEDGKYRKEIVVEGKGDLPSRAEKLKATDRSPKGIVRPSLQPPDLVLFFTSEVRGAIETCG